MKKNKGLVFLKISLSTKNTGKMRSGEVYRMDLANWMNVWNHPLPRKLDEVQKCSQYFMAYSKLKNGKINFAPIRTRTRNTAPAMATPRYRKTFFLSEKAFFSTAKSSAIAKMAKIKLTFIRNPPIAPTNTRNHHRLSSHSDPLSLK